MRSGIIIIKVIERKNKVKALEQTEAIKYKIIFFKTF